MILPVFGKRCIVLMLALCFVACLFVAFKAPVTPSSYCNEIGRLPDGTPIYKTSDNGVVLYMVKGYSITR